jgi:hypothetical protein
MPFTTDEMLERYFLATIQAMGALYEKHLFGHMLLVVYSTIDTLGLLSAPPAQSSATGESFKSWTKKYLLPQPNVEFNEVDLWGARCAVLHAFTSESELSRSGRARELQFYSGNKSGEAAREFVEATRALEEGGHLPVHYQDFCDAFFSALKQCVPDLQVSCSAHPQCFQRLKNVLQVHPLAPAL